MAPLMPRSCRALVTATAVVVMALLAGLLPTAPVAAHSAPSPSVAAIEQRMAELANQSRAAVGARPLAIDVSFAAAARTWSCQMARTDAFAHDPNYAAGGALAEIIAARSGTDGDPGAELHQQFLDSPTHREILLNPAYTRVGIGVCVLNGYWVTERFGTGAATAAPTPTTSAPSPSTVRPTPTTTPSRVRPTPTTIHPVRPTPARARRREPAPSHLRRPDAAQAGSVQGSVAGSLGVGPQQPGSGALSFTGTIAPLPLVLVALVLVLAGAVALRLGRTRYRPARLRR
jgi:uncharacterized protein YkwD